MFVIQPRLFSIETIVVFTPVTLKQLVSFVSSIGLNLVEQVFDALIEPVFILLVQIIIPHDTFKQSLLETLFQLEVRKMTINQTLTCEQVQNLCIVGQTIIEQEQFTKIKAKTLGDRNPKWKEWWEIVQKFTKE